jgi:excisionase family DNA binding protein
MLNVSILTFAVKRMNSMLSVKELASRLCMTSDHVWRLCREGDVPHTRINGRTIRFDADEINQWIASGKQPLKSKECGQ